MNKGDHLVSPRFGYTHHGLYIGNNKVIHYSGFATELSRGKISITSIDEFANGNSVSVHEHLFRRYEAEESVERAVSRLGEDWYNVLVNNCEHFVTWCITGFHSSSQVNSAIIAIAGSYKAIKELKNAKRAIELASIVASASNTVNTTRTASTIAGLATTTGIAATSGILSSTGTATAVTAGIAAVGAAPVLGSIAAACLAGYAVKGLFDWFSDY